MKDIGLRYNMKQKYHTYLSPGVTFWAILVKFVVRNLYTLEQGKIGSVLREIR